MDLTGTWNLVMKTPMGAQKSVLILAEANNETTGTLKMPANAPSKLTQFKRTGDAATMNARISSPSVMNMVLTLEFDGHSVSGTCDSGTFRPFPVTGTRFVAPVDERGRFERWRDFLFR